jgi:cell division protein ZapA (FtsZ GTPase activity inhibitor)
VRVPPAIALAVVLAALAAAGCGVPSEPKKQAEEVESVAAEGALLAHDASEGRTTATFTRVHVQTLRERLTVLRPKIVERELALIARDVDSALQKLEESPSDADVEAPLDEAAKAAGELAK